MIIFKKVNFLVYLNILKLYHHIRKTKNDKANYRPMSIFSIGKVNISTITPPF